MVYVSLVVKRVMVFALIILLQKISVKMNSLVTSEAQYSKKRKYEPFGFLKIAENNDRDCLCPPLFLTEQFFHALIVGGQ